MSSCLHPPELPTPITNEALLTEMKSIKDMYEAGTVSNGTSSVKLFNMMYQLIMKEIVRCKHEESEHKCEMVAYAISNLQRIWPTLIGEEVLYLFEEIIYVSFLQVLHRKKALARAPRV